jgi:YaiO family outer membrane protein
MRSRHALSFLVAAMALPLGAQEGEAPRAPAVLGVDVGGFYQSLDNGYSDWRGADLRVSLTSPALSPFVSVSTQHRREGHQENFGLGSYVTIDRHFYAIGGVSAAPGGTAVLYPRLRADVALVSDTRVVPGLMIATGLTYLMADRGSTGEIVSVGPIWYRGPLIVTAALRLNHDGVGGANSGSGDVGVQYGAQGRYWIGAGFGTGREAYQLLSATPFDVRFTNVGGSLFYQRWLTAKTAITTRFDYEHKLTAYRRRGITLWYHVER